MGGFTSLGISTFDGLTGACLCSTGMYISLCTSVCTCISARSCIVHVTLLPETSISCDFETNFKCGYLMEGSGSLFTWVRYQGVTPSVQTGPIVDHTFMSAYGK